MDEVRNDKGELVGWLDYKTPLDELRLTGFEDGGAGLIEICIRRSPFRAIPWKVSEEHLAKLRRTDIFKPLITEELMMAAAGLAAALVGRHLPYTVDVDCEKLARDAVRETLARCDPHPLR